MTMQHFSRLRLALPLALLAVPALHATRSRISARRDSAILRASSARTPWAPAGRSVRWDPLSPINPAAIGAFQTRILLFQIEPEFRSVNTPAGTERTTTARYPNVFGALPVGPVVPSSRPPRC